MTQWVYVVCKRYQPDDRHLSDHIRPDGVWGVCTSHEEVEANFPGLDVSWVEDDKPTTAFQIAGVSADSTYWILKRTLVGNLDRENSSG